jgi:hypothetical protein
MSPGVCLCTSQDADDDGLWNDFSRYNASVDFRNFTGSIAGKRLPAGAEVSLAPELDAADRDLGLRLRNRPADAPWWAMADRSGGPSGATVHQLEGELVPILVDSLGEPVVARQAIRHHPGVPAVHSGCRACGSTARPGSQPEVPSGGCGTPASVRRTRP